MNESVQTILDEIAGQAQRENHPIIGWHKGKVLEEAVKKRKPLHVVEVGTNIGFSGLLIIRNLPKDGVLTTIEVDPTLAKIAHENFTKAGVADRVRIIVGDAKRMLKTITEPIDCLFLDALKEEYIIYLEEAEPLLSPDATIVADNVEIFKDALADYLEYVKRNPLYQSRTIYVEEAGDAVEISKFLGK